MYGPNFLREYEWVFGTSKSAVVRTVLRWNDSSIRCSFYDWSEDDPAEYRFFFLDRESRRAAQQAKKLWTAEDEADYLKRTPETYRGWWKFSGLPGGYDANEWFSPGDAPELFDPNMAPVEVARLMHEQTFHEWQIGGGEVEAHDHSGIEETLAYWRKERDSGSGYYGDENEGS